MQICMKLASESKRLLVAEMRAQMDARRMGVSQLGRYCGVDQSQVTRILARDFKGISHNVMQICISLGIDPLRFVGPVREDEVAKRRITDSALAVWDGTPEGADLLVSILGAIAAMRATRRK